MRPRRVRQAIMKIRISSNYIHRHHVKVKIMATEDFMLLVQNPFQIFGASAPIRLRLHRLYGLAVLP